MTTNIEQEFFECFEIKPVWKDYRCQNTTVYTEEQAKEIRKTNRNIQLVYPEITSDILLQLLCILNEHYSKHYQIASMVVGKNIEEVKKSILNDCIEQCKHIEFKNQVQSLFTEVGE